MSHHLRPRRSSPSGGRPRTRAGALTLSAALLSVGLLLGAAEAPQDGETAPARQQVTVLEVEGIIQPVIAEYLLEQLAAADERGDALVVVQLATPGGMLDQTRRITSAMLEAETPVAVFVYPRGEHAASAGFFLLMAADIAAMAPGTNTGAAHPVAGTGTDIEGDMGAKVEQDTAAMIRSLASERGRDAVLAEQAVLESRSFSASEALEAGLIDVIADDLDSLLETLEGRPFGVDGERTLQLAEASVQRSRMSPFQRIRSTIAHPNIALMLLSLGSLGLYFEFSNPGAGFPGVLGAICIVLGLYGTSVLPVNYAGLALFGLAMLFFLAEIKAPSFGLFGIGGIASLVLGALMLFPSADPALQVSRQLIVALAAVSVVVVGFVSMLLYRSRNLRVATGSEGLSGERGVARTAIAPGAPGKAFVHGELWNAVSSVEIDAGQEVAVESVQGLTLEVRPSGSAVGPVEAVSESVSRT